MQAGQCHVGKTDPDTQLGSSTDISKSFFLILFKKPATLPPKGLLGQFGRFLNVLPPTLFWKSCRSVATSTADQIRFGRFRAGQNQKLTSFCCSAQPVPRGTFKSTSHFCRPIWPGPLDMPRTPYRASEGKRSQ